MQCVILNWRICKLIFPGPRNFHEVPSLFVSWLLKEIVSELFRVIGFLSQKNNWLDAIRMKMYQHFGQDNSN